VRLHDSSKRDEGNEVSQGQPAVAAGTPEFAPTVADEEAPTVSRMSGRTYAHDGVVVACASAYVRHIDVSIFMGIVELVCDFYQQHNWGGSGQDIFEFVLHAVVDQVQLANGAGVPRWDADSVGRVLSTDAKLVVVRPLRQRRLTARGECSASVVQSHASGPGLSVSGAVCPDRLRCQRFG